MDFFSYFFLIGNEHLHQLTSLGASDFYVRLQKFTGGWTYAKYNEISVADEAGKYRLKVKFNSYQGNAGMETHYLLTHSTL